MTAVLQAPLATRLNETCQCLRVDRARLEGTGIPASLASGNVVFVDPHQAAAMDRTVRAIHRVVASPAFERRVAASAPDIARAARPTAGGVLGFDFHLGGAEPQLIEINTNPGGLLINLELARATGGCDCYAAMLAANFDLDGLARRVVDGFRAEWRRARGDRELRTIAIVDDDPATQPLAVEFRLYRHLLEQAGFHVQVVDPAALAVHEAALRLDGDAVDLVYNRLTDFYFTDARHAALREAYERDLAVITPHPAAHARWADKRLLAWLRDDALLLEAGLAAPERRQLHATIPATELVDAHAAADLWQRRKALFFKPLHGYGSRAAYRGDKLTRGTFERILTERYVAQTLAPTSTRHVATADGARVELRVDVRNYVDAGDTLLRAARLYRGQTTNFRTAGGGFAPVLTVPLH